MSRVTHFEAYEREKRIRDIEEEIMKLRAFITSDANLQNATRYLWLRDAAPQRWLVETVESVGFMDEDIDVMMKQYPTLESILV